MKILIIAPYPLGRAPSQRFRFEHFLKFIEEKGIAYDFQSFLSINTWENLYKQGNRPAKTIGVLNGFFRRVKLLFYLNKYDCVFLHREASPIGPPVFEFTITKIFKKRLIYDFDDAIWLNDPNQESTLWRWLKWRSKVGRICSWSWKVAAGNQYLADFAKEYCDQVVILPTVINSQIHKPINQKLKADRMPVIGWTGSHSTLPYLDQITPILQMLEKEFEFQFLVIANKNPHLPLKNFQFKEWNKATEIQDLSLMDIGLMPLEHNQWSKGKCGFKLIQYLSLGIPAVASPVGVNTDLIIQNETGLLAHSSSEWMNALKTLIRNPHLRESMGNNGRHLIVTRYSVESTKEEFLNIFSA